MSALKNNSSYKVLFMLFQLKSFLICYLICDARKALIDIKSALMVILIILWNSVILKQWWGCLWKESKEEFARS